MDQIEQTLTKIDIYTSQIGLDVVGAALEELGQPTFTITDPGDFDSLLEGKFGAWDYFDKNLTKLRDAETFITLYLPDNEQSRKTVDEIHEMLKTLSASDPTGTLGKLTCQVSHIKNEDWDNLWKESFRPFPVGHKLMICLPWDNEEFKDKTILRIEPGQAFGTGTDETTKLSLEMLESIAPKGKTVLDIGCGSGILSIAALLLGADSALGIDIDQTAVDIATANAVRNNVSDRAKYICGNLIDAVTESYDIICANIIADVIIMLLPQVSQCLKPNGRLILSGIITDREQEVMEIALKHGFTCAERREENGWVCLTVFLDCTL